MPKCRACPAQIWWAKSEATGAAMPLNPAPCDDGNIIITARPPQAAQIMVHVLHKGEEPPADTPRYKSHFATCRGRKKRRK